MMMCTQSSSKSVHHKSQKEDKSLSMVLRPKSLFSLKNTPARFTKQAQRQLHEI